ncbi:hypothetical protein Mgra_00008584, partial [Meloidogyne graminicola]
MKTYIYLFILLCLLIELGICVKSKTKLEKQAGTSDASFIGVTEKDLTQKYIDSLCKHDDKWKNKIRQIAAFLLDKKLTDKKSKIENQLESLLKLSKKQTKHKTLFEIF